MPHPRTPDPGHGAPSAPDRPAPRIGPLRAGACILVAGISLVLGAPGPGRAQADAPDAGASRSAHGTYTAPLDGEPRVAHPFDRPAEVWAAGHRGVDLAAAPGDEVLAPADGVISFAGQVAGRGVVTVTHGDGLRSSLEPVDPLVSVGQRVTRGATVATLDAIGTDPAPAGSGTHCAPTTCLHWGVRRGTQYLDPLSLLGDQGPVVLLP
ncbi:murein hydrolase activator EnvC family protein [Cellulomonas soli]|uniref:murein hydrolase activator EnvC family protein n=1 Tax=Cellulomonas soli TaxID=931535 RepID=UPI003F8323F4